MEEEYTVLQKIFYTNGRSTKIHIPRLVNKLSVM